MIYNITFEWISGAKNKAADCLSRLVLPTGNSINMLTASVNDGPSFHTRNCTQSTSNSAPPVMPQPHISQGNSPTLKSLTDDRQDALLRMQCTDPFCKCISRRLLNSKPHIMNVTPSLMSKAYFTNMSLMLESNFWL